MGKKQCPLCAKIFTKKSIKKCKTLSWKERIERVVRTVTRGVYWAGWSWSLQQICSSDSFRIQSLFQHIRTGIHLSLAAPLIGRGLRYLFDHRPTILIAVLPTTGTASALFYLWLQNSLESVPLEMLFSLRESSWRFATWIPCLIFPDGLSAVAELLKDGTQESAADIIAWRELSDSAYEASLPAIPVAVTALIARKMFN